MSRARGSTVLLVLSLVWLGAMLWSANANITGTGNALGALIQVADALPVVIAASMLAGAATALAVLTRLRLRARLHWPVALGSGAAVGAVAAGLILIGYGHRSSITVLAISVVVAGAVGGALGALKPPELVAAVFRSRASGTRRSPPIRGPAPATAAAPAAARGSCRARSPSKCGIPR